MKVRDSGMPVEDMGASFFNVELILSELQINSDIEDLVEIGCGYGISMVSGYHNSFPVVTKPLITISDR